MGPLLCAPGFAAAQAPALQPEQTVRWTAALRLPSAGQRNGAASLELSAQVLEGWHVYALTQRPGGPVALRVSIDENAFAQSAGAATGSKPRRRHDPSFDLETQIYTHSFALHLPLRLSPGDASAGGTIPVSVRFQSCSDHECLPPRTVHLTVPFAPRPEPLARLDSTSRGTTT